MLPDSHQAPMNEPSLHHLLLGDDLDRGRASDALLLADAFSEFISASARLEASYRELQQEVVQLGVELADRNRALNASLQENERMRAALEQIVDSMPCGVLVLDRDGSVSIMNAESTRLLALDGHPPRTLDEVCSGSRMQLESFYGDGLGGDAEQEFAQERPEGKRWLAVRRRKLFATATAGEARHQTILILRDITAQKQAEQEREAARKAMALAEVAALLAHEIRNPLTSLELFAGLIAEDPSRRAEWIRYLRAGIRSLAGTVTNVLSFHSLGRMQRDRLELCAAIEAAVEFARPIAEQAGVALSFAGREAEVLTLANAGALQQVVLNLVSNAIRHTQSGGCVHIAVAAADGKARFACADTGSGIAADQLDRIFEAGFSGSGQSCGLGLAVCRQIITQHGGEIRCSSRVGQGTTFHVELPLL